jgi:hypothetical protein
VGARKADWFERMLGQMKEVTWADDRISFKIERTDKDTALVTEIGGSGILEDEVKLWQPLQIKVVSIGDRKMIEVSAPGGPRPEQWLMAPVPRLVGLALTNY